MTSVDQPSSRSGGLPDLERLIGSSRFPRLDCYARGTSG
jgi:hypothetical protein